MKIFYAIARIINDIKAIFSGKIVKRTANKMIGRKVVSKLWIR